MSSMGFQTIEPQESPIFEEQVVEALGGRPSLAFECAGNGPALNGAIRAVARGGTVIVVGVYEDPPKTDMVLVQDKELALVGSLMYAWDDYYRAVEVIADRTIDVKALVTHHVPFDRWGEGYTLLRERPGEVLKVVVDV